MILYGRRGQNAATGTKPGLCGNCNRDVQFTYAVSNNYFHLFFVPTFPIGKSVALVCPVCKTVSYDHEISAPFKNELKAQNAEKLKVPFFHFSGLILIGCLILYGVYSSKAEASLTREYLNAPKPGDIYEVKLNANAYTVYKLKDARHDTLRFITNRYQSSSSAGLIDLESKDSTFDHTTSDIFNTVLLKKRQRKCLRVVIC